MENKNTDIESLFDKLHSFEVEPNANAWHNIQDNINYGLDGLYENLHEIEIEPDKKSEVFLFEHLGFNNPIDLFLNDNLSELEVDPEKSLNDIIPQNRNRKKALVLFISLIAAVVLGILTLNQTETDQVNKTSEKVSSEYLLNENSSLSNSPNSQSPAIKMPFIKRENSTIKLNDKFRINEESTADMSVYFPEDIDEINSKIYPVKNEINYPFEPLQQAEYRKVKLDKKLLPKFFQIVGGLGFQNQQLKNVQIENAEYQHKDAIDNYWKSTGKNILGIQLSAGISFNLSEKFYWRTSFQYQYMQSNNEFVYSYTDIPVYGIDGKIIGYFKRPLSASPSINQTIKTTKQTVNMPIEAFYKIFNLNKNTVYAGLGLNIELSNQFKSSDFSFAKEELSLLKIKAAHKLSPSLSLQYHYQINSQMKMILQIDGRKTNSIANFDESKFKSSYFNSSISIGFSFIPKI